MALDQAISELTESLEQDRAGTQWRAQVRVRLAAVRQALAEDRPRFRDGWLSARGRRVTERDRRQLLARISALGPRVLEHPDNERSYREIRRLTLDLQHYRQRVHDLVYDSVGLELGGSE
jgi:hypothetical protein